MLYKVPVYRMHPEFSEVEVEASSPEEALAKARNGDFASNPKWYGVDYDKTAATEFPEDTDGIEEIKPELGEEG